MSQTLRILQLYPHDMNVYGDWGNALTLKRRAEWHGLDVELLEYNPGDEFPRDIHLIVGGGGQDSGQTVVHEDLMSIGAQLHTLANDGLPMLMICGLYQLFGHSMKLQNSQELRGVGIFDIETQAGPQRLIGNTIIENSLFGDIVGYENHSGLTYLGAQAEPFGFVRRGAGNNGQDSSEGAMYKNVIGTYLHGSLLPKNPRIADFLLEKAAVRAFGNFTPTVIDDYFADKARAAALRLKR